MSDPKTAENENAKGAGVRSPGFQQGSTSPEDKHLPENSQDNLDDKLDHALEETFPTSDPISVKITK